MAAATTKKQKNAIADADGARHAVIWDLKYGDWIRSGIVDTAHCVFLGETNTLRLVD